MLSTKRRWGKAQRKRQGYHIIQSFAPGEVTPDQAHAIGVELVQRLLGDRYEAVVSTHLNKAHLHSHIVFNSVSFVDGAMYRDQLKDYYDGIRGTSDAICREHGLSIIEPGELLKGTPVSRGEWAAQRRGRPTMRGLGRQDIEEAIRQSYTYKSFLDQLRQMGYYFGVIGTFAVGAGIGGICSHLYGIHVIWISCLLLLVSFIVMSLEKLK